MTAVRKARTEDMAGIWTLVCRAVADMNRLGNPQWGPDYPTQALYQEDLERGELYVALIDGALAGVACINTGEAPEYGAVAWTTLPPAVVIHRMAVDPQVQRRGVGRALFEFAEEEARRQGLKAMRIDTYSLNTRMQGLILSQGFTQVGEVRLRRPLPYPCFEKALN